MKEEKPHVLGSLSLCNQITFQTFFLKNISELKLQQQIGVKTEFIDEEGGRSKNERRSQSYSLQTIKTFSHVAEKTTGTGNKVF